MIGLFDSGRGGLSLLTALRSALPRADLLYFADTENLPYGKKTEEELFTLSRRAVTLLRAEGADAVIAACGTVSSTVLPALAAKTTFPLFGITEGIAEAIPADARGELLLLATARTVKAGGMAAAIRKRAPALGITALPCPSFVTLAERELPARDPRRTALAVSHALRVQRGRPFSYLVLGCTHFSALAPAIAPLFPNARIIDGALDGAAYAAKKLRAEHPALCEGRGETHFLG